VAGLLAADRPAQAPELPLYWADRPTMGILMLRFAALTCIALLPLAALAEDRMRPGEWEISMSSEVGGMKMPAVTHKTCVKAGESTNDEAAARRSLPKDCSVSDMKSSGSKVSWKTSCTGENAMSGKGEFDYKDDSFDGTMQMSSPALGEFTTHTSGRRIGDC
jgi:hypothetical protein